MHEAAYTRYLMLKGPLILLAHAFLTPARIAAERRAKAEAEQVA